MRYLWRPGKCYFHQCVINSFDLVVGVGYHSWIFSGWSGQLDECTWRFSALWLGRCSVRFSGLFLCIWWVWMYYNCWWGNTKPFAIHPNCPLHIHVPSHSDLCPLLSHSGTHGTVLFGRRVGPFPNCFCPKWCYLGNLYCRGWFIYIIFSIAFRGSICRRSHRLCYGKWWFAFPNSRQSWPQNTDAYTCKFDVLCFCQRFGPFCWFRSFSEFSLNWYDNELHRSCCKCLGSALQTQRGMYLWSKNRGNGDYRGWWRTIGTCKCNW